MNDAHPRPAVQRPRLLLIELDYHAEVLTTLCPILTIRFDLVLWTTDKIWKKVGLAEQLFAAVLVMPKKQRVATFWRANEAVLRSVDFVYFNTLEKRFAFFADLKFHCPTVMRIHNSNASLFPVQSIDWSPRNWWNICSYLFRYVLIGRVWHQRERLYQKMTALMLPSEGVAARLGNALRDKGIDNLSAYIMPFSSLGGEQTVKVGPAHVFAVTGSVDARRKDYAALFHALERLKSLKPEWHLEIVFLGWAKGDKAKKILDRFAQLQDTRFRFTCFREYVSQQTFVEQMARTQFLIAPMKLTAHHKIHREYYGSTKISGIENDLLRYRKPVILPENYTLPADLTRVASCYRDPQSLCDAIISMIEGDRWRELTERFAGLHNYQSASIANNFHDYCLSLLNRASIQHQPAVEESV